MKSLDQNRREKKYLVIHADDFGLQYSFNDGILKACKEGVLTSACLRAGGHALQDALDRVVPNCPELGLGAHLCLNEGKSVTVAGKLPHLCNPDGRFRYSQAIGFAFLKTQRKNVLLRHEVFSELRSQIELLLKHVRLDHINSHQHVHLIPWLFDIFLELAEYYGIRFIRIPTEPIILSPLLNHIPRPAVWLHYWNLCRLSRRARKAVGERTSLSTNKTFWGLLHTGYMSNNVCRAYLCSKNVSSLTEMLLHPAVPNHKLDTEYADIAMEHYCNSQNRAMELESLISPEMRSLISDNGFTLTNYRELLDEKVIDGN